MSQKTYKDISILVTKFSGGSKILTLENHVSTTIFWINCSIAFVSDAEHVSRGQAGRQSLVDIYLGGRLRSSGREISFQVNLGDWETDDI